MNSSNSSPLSEQLIDDRSIRREVTKRLSGLVIEDAPIGEQSEWESRGWTLNKMLKRKLKMQKPKSQKQAFVDQVWAMAAKLGFKDLNVGDGIDVPYGSGPDEVHRFDVFAADAEVVLLFDVGSAGEPRSHSFRSELELLAAQRAGLLRYLRGEYPGRKVKCVVAANNLYISPATRERFDEAGVVFLDEEAVEYYLNLADHLGAAARFQLLGALFVGTKIPELDNTVPALEGKMGGHTYYTFAIEPARLLKLGFILHRNKANSELMPTYQRLIKRSRLRSVAEFVEGGGFFPNSVILNLEKGRRLPRFEKVAPRSGRGALGLLHLPQTYRAAYIIDGQHRLYGYANSSRSETDMIPVVAFVGLPRSEQVRIFMQINENQKSVPKNLRNTLNADLLWNSADLRQQVRALKLRIAQHLGEQKSSPLFGRIVVGEDARSETRCITIDAVSNGLERGAFIGSFTKSEVRSSGSFYDGTNDGTFSQLVPFLEDCFTYLRDNLPEQWSIGNGEGGFVFINNGIEALLRLTSDIVDHLVDTEVVPSPPLVHSDELFGHVAPFLSIVVEFIQSLDADEGHEFRRMYGSAGRTEYWRKLQLAVNSREADFEPTGLLEHLVDEERRYNTESFGMVRDLEQFFHRDIRHRLESKFGDHWWRSGVPTKVRKSATDLKFQKDEQREPGDEVDVWDCLHLIEYYAIVTDSQDLWSELFEDRYTPPGEESSNTSRKRKASWMEQLNRIRNDVDHNYVVSEEDYEFLTDVTNWFLVEGS